jgi:preprotein translocase subunit SecE
MNLGKTCLLFHVRFFHINFFSFTSQIPYDKLHLMSFSQPMMPNFTGGPVIFLKEVKAELSKVIWPTRQEIVRLTIIVIAVSVIIGLYIGGLDLLFTKMTDLLVKR